MDQIAAIGWGTWPSIVGTAITVVAAIWGVAFMAYQLRTTSAILSRLEPRVVKLEDWRIQCETRDKLRAEIRAELEAERDRDRGVQS